MLTAAVARVDFGSCLLLKDDGEFLEANARGKLMGPKKSLGNVVVVGDLAHYELDQDRVMIVDVEPRRNAFSRRASGSHPEEQVMAANIDQVVVVASIEEPSFSSGFVDRVLSQAEHAGIPACIALTKTDLAGADAADALIADYRAAGFTACAVSAVARQGLDAVQSQCAGRRSLFVGHSGVGKSSLLNAIVPGLELIAGLVNAKTLKGRHTTTAAWLIRPGGDFELIDTPGMRAFGLWGVDSNDLEQTYPEFRPLLGSCRFGDCRHEAEPGCALRGAVAARAIPARRFESFLKLRSELRREEAEEIEKVRGNTRYRR